MLRMGLVCGAWLIAIGTGSGCAERQARVDVAERAPDRAEQRIAAEVDASPTWDERMAAYEEVFAAKAPAEIDASELEGLYHYGDWLRGVVMLTLQEHGRFRLLPVWHGSDEIWGTWRWDGRQLTMQPRKEDAASPTALSMPRTLDVIMTAEGEAALVPTLSWSLEALRSAGELRHDVAFLPGPAEDLTTITTHVELVLAVHREFERGELTPISDRAALTKRLMEAPSGPPPGAEKEAGEIVSAREKELLVATIVEWLQRQSDPAPDRYLAWVRSRKLAWTPTLSQSAAFFYERITGQSAVTADREEVFRTLYEENHRANDLEVCPQAVSGASEGVRIRFVRLREPAAAEHHFVDHVDQLRWLGLASKGPRRHWDSATGPASIIQRSGGLLTASVSVGCLGKSGAWMALTFMCYFDPVRRVWHISDIAQRNTFVEATFDY
ncbi:MAG: hypothetical protein VYC34_01220 [Planctomycetota bacterium]|nr:hypothetical protein [Planctomycetota bacterium]